MIFPVIIISEPSAYPGKSVFTDIGGSVDWAFARFGIPNDRIANDNNKIEQYAIIFI